MENKDPKHKAQKSLTRFLEIPADLTLEMPKLTLIGNIQLVMENHRGLIELTPNRVVISGSRWPVILTGRNLMVRMIRTDDLMVEGIIETIAFGE